MRCPDLRKPDVRREFNRVMTTLGGRAMSESDVSPRQPYIATLSDLEQRAYWLAHKYWHDAKTIKAAVEFVENLQTARAELLTAAELKGVGVRLKPGVPAKDQSNYVGGPEVFKAYSEEDRKRLVEHVEQLRKELHEVGPYTVEQIGRNLVVTHMQSGEPVRIPGGIETDLSTGKSTNLEGRVAGRSLLTEDGKPWPVAITDSNWVNYAREDAARRAGEKRERPYRAPSAAEQRETSRAVVGVGLRDVIDHAKRVGFTKLANMLPAFPSSDHPLGNYREALERAKAAVALYEGGDTAEAEARVESVQSALYRRKPPTERQKRDRAAAEEAKRKEEQKLGTLLTEHGAKAAAAKPQRIEQLLQSAKADFADLRWRIERPGDGGILNVDRPSVVIENIEAKERRKGEGRKLLQKIKAAGYDVIPEEIEGDEAWPFWRQMAKEGLANGRYFLEPEELTGPETRWDPGAPAEARVGRKLGTTPKQVANPSNDQPIAASPENTLLLMACSDTKAATAGPLRELYQGPLWQTLRTHRGAVPWDGVLVLSGEHGLVPADFHSEPYEKKLTTAKADEVTITQLLDGLREFHKLDALWSRGPIKNVLVVGSGDYRRVFHTLVNQMQEAGKLAPNAAVRTMEGGIGEQRQQLGHALASVNQAPGEQFELGQQQISDKPVNTPLVPNEGDKLLTPPEGTAPARNVEDLKVPTDQLKLFSPQSFYLVNRDTEAVVAGPYKTRREAEEARGGNTQDDVKLGSELPQSAVDEAAEQAKGHEASEAQQVAGNYQKGHVQLGPAGATMEGAIETPAGESRRPEWPKLADHYGYFKGTVGFDKDHLDFFIVPGTPADFSGTVYVVNQTKGEAGKGGFDEHKIILGAPAEGARDVYTRNYEAGWSRYSSITPITWAGFRAWAMDHSQRGPKGGELTLAAARQFDEASALPTTPGTDQLDRGPEAQRDLFSAPEIPGTQGARNLEGLTVAMEKQRSVKLPKGRITTWQDAAHAFRELNRWPRERFQMIGVNKRGTPIAFYDLFSGTVTQTSVYPREVWTALYMTPGVEGVWFAHNHPSGLASPSQADELLTRNLKEMLRPGMGVTYKGHVIITADQAFSIDEYARTSLAERPAPMEWRSVPVMERVITQQAAADRPELTSPGAARDYIRNLKPQGNGLILLDAQHRALGWWPLDAASLSRVGFTGRPADIIRMVGVRNPAAAFLYTTMQGEDASTAARGLKEMLELAEVKLLDTFTSNTVDGRLISYAERGLMEPTTPYDVSRGVFQLESAYDIPQRARGMTPEALQAEIGEHPLARGLGTKLRIVADARDLPALAVQRLSQIGGLNKARGYTDLATGDVYLVAGNLNPGEAEITLVHEAVGHMGVIGLFATAPEYELPALENAAGLWGQISNEYHDIFTSREGAIRTAVNDGFLKPYGFQLEYRQHRVAAAMEYVAHMAERGQEPDLWQRVAALWRRVLRALGYKAQWTDGDILDLLRRSRYALENRGQDLYNGLALWQLGEQGPIWYSALERAVEGIPQASASPQQWLATIKARPGVKKAELEWSGLEEWLTGPAQFGAVEKERILAFLRDNGVRVSERLLGGRPPSNDDPSEMRRLLAERDQLTVELDAEGFDVEYAQDGTFNYLHRRSTGGDMFYFPEDVPEVTQIEKHDDLVRELNRWLDERHISERYSSDDLLAEAEAGAAIPRRDGTPARLSTDEIEYLRQYGQRWERMSNLDGVHDINTLASGIVRRARRIREIAPTTRYAEEQPTNDTRYSQYTLPGGEDYRELLITLPQKEVGTDWEHAGPGVTFQSSHFDEPNILAHVRFKTRTDAEGKRVLFIEEIQSDWAERGRKIGFIKEYQRSDLKISERQQYVVRNEAGNIFLRADTEKATMEAALKKVELRKDMGPMFAAPSGRQRNGLPTGYTIGHETLVIVESPTGASSAYGMPGIPVETAHRTAQTAIDTGALDTFLKSEGLPPAPFVTSTQQWAGLAFKRMIRYAADHGFDRVAWTTGQQQADRYSLEKHIKVLEYKHRGDQVWLRATRHGENQYPEQIWHGPLSGLDDVVGRETAEKIRNGAGTRQYGEDAQWRAMGNLDLRIGGEGMKAYYDNMLPIIAGDVIKKFGGQGVRKVHIEAMSDSTNASLAIARSQGREDVTIHHPTAGAQPYEYVVTGQDTGTVYYRGPSYDEAGTVAQRVRLPLSEQPGFDITPAMREKVVGGLPLFQLKDQPGLNEVYGVRDGRLLGYATRPYGQGAWNVYIAADTNAPLEGATYRRSQAASVGEVQRMFNVAGLELKVIRPSEMPRVDRNLLSLDWTPPRVDSQEGDTFGMRVGNWLDRVKIDLQNRLLLPEKYERAIERQLGNIPEEAKAHREARIAHPRAAGKIADAHHDYVDPIIDLMRRNKLTLKQAGLYRYAQHAPERNQVIEERNPENKAGSGISDERAAGILADLRAELGPERFAALEQIGQMLDRMVYASEEVMLDKGLADKVAVTLMRRYKHYAPLKEFEEDEHIQGETGSGYRVSAKLVRTALGRYSEADAEMILPALVAQLKGRIAAGENAEVLRAFLRQVQFAPNDAVWRVEKEFFKPRLNREGVVEWRAARPSSRNVIQVPIEGERVNVWVMDPRIAKAFNESGLQLPDALSWMGTLTRFYANMATSINPEFVLTNLMRDAQEAMIRVGGEQGPVIAAKAMRDIGPAFWGAYSGVRAKGQYVPGESAKPGAEKWHAWYRRYIEAGGHVAYRGIQQAEQAHEDFITRLAESGIYPESASGVESLKLRARRVTKLSGAQWVVQQVADINAAVENATRLAVFKNAVEAGLSDKDAAMVSRNATVDFNLRGEHTGIWNQLYMFFNANVQGSAILLRSIANHPKIRALTLLMIAMGMMWDRLNREMSDKDAAGRFYYDNISEDIKSRNWIIMGPDRQNAIMIPLPFGFGIFANVGRHLNAMLSKEHGGANEKALDAAANVFASTVNAFSPFGNLPTNLAGAVQLVSPTFLDPFVQWWTNTNWLGRPIHPERPKYAKPQAEALTYFPGTPEIYIRGAEFMNHLGGGDRVGSSWLDTYPNVLQHWVNSVFGSAGATYVRIGQYLGAKAKGEEAKIEAKDVPFLRRFYYEPKDYELSHRFYDYLNKSEVAHGRIEAAMVDGRANEAALLRNELQVEAKMYGDGQAAERQVAQISAELSKLRKDTRRTEAEKKVIREKQEEQRRRIMQGFTTRFEQQLEQ